MTNKQRQAWEIFMSQKRDINDFGFVANTYNKETKEYEDNIWKVDATDEELNNEELVFDNFDDFVYDCNVENLMETLQDLSYPVTFNVTTPEGNTGTKTIENAEEMLEMLTTSYARDVLPYIMEGVISLPTHDRGGGLIVSTSLILKGAENGKNDK